MVGAMRRWGRREFLGRAAGVGAFALVRRGWGSGFLASGVGEALEPWRRGLLDIHHIATGRGNSVLTVCPDGTSVVIDAGAKAGTGKDVAPEVPSGERRPGEWIGRYVQRQLRATGRGELDYVWVTHLHDDHVGTSTAESPMASSGAYRLTGVSDLAAIVPVRRLLDRGYPEYSYPMVQTDLSALNYIAFAKWSATHGVKVERVKVGSQRQVVLQHEPAAFPTFAVRNLAASGEVWIGVGEQTTQLFPALAGLKKEEYPTENACSAALRMEYGRFRYYNGGDLTCDTRFGTTPWMDVETAVAQVAGPVSVASLNHHGYYDADGDGFVRAMRARVWVLQNWHASHPALATLDRLYSPILYSGPRDVLATSLVEAAELADARLSDKMLSQQGHVVVRVAEGGGSYEVIVVDDAVEDGKVKARFGPFVS